MSTFNFPKEDELLLEDVLTDIGNNSEIIVFNDDFNTFDWVIKSFVDVCKHKHTQAEQLSLLIHYKGKASVKTGPKETLKPIKDALVDRGLSAVIEEFA